MKVLLTGATGFLGFRTLEKLVEDDRISSVVATGRTIKDTHFVDHPKVKYLLGDLNDYEFVKELSKDIDSIIHAAALSSPWGLTEEFERANVNSQKHLIAAAKEFDINRFVYVSTPSVYFELQDKYNVRESDPLPGKFINEYARTKRDAEILLSQSGIPHIMLRPRALTGRGDTVIMPRLIRAQQEGRLRIIGSGKNVVDLTSVANVADAIILGLFANGPALNEVYNIANGEPVRLWDTIADVLEKLNLELPNQRVSFPVIKLLAQGMELKSRLTNHDEPTLTVYGVGTLAKSFTMDISKARNLLQYEPAVSTKEAIEEFVNWYNEEN